MATKFWEGKAAAVKQTATVQVTADDAATTYSITIGGVSISVAGSGTGVNDTATALHTALTGATHPYFAAIDWTLSTDTITATAGTAGVPFTASSSATGGTGTIGAVTAGTANVSPNDWADGDNWSDGSVPANGDTVYVKDTDVSISWNLDQNTLDLVALIIEQSFTGTIGLRSSAFATSSDGVTVDADATEYRDTYLKLGADTIDIGQHLGPGEPTGSTRIKVHNNEAGASTLTVHNTAATGEGTKPAVLYLSDNASADVDIRKAPGGFGYAADAPGETSNADAIIVSETGNEATVFVGEGVDYATFEQRGGTNTIDITAAAATVDITVHGGELTIEGLGAIDQLNVYDAGQVIDNHSVSSGDNITTVTVDGETALLDWTQAGQARQVGTTNWRRGSISADWDDLTLTTLNLGQRLRTIEVADI